MTKQEKIREGIKDMLSGWGIGNWDIDHSAIDDLLNYLHSQGAVLKVDRKLPINPIKITHYLGLSMEEADTRQLEQDCFVQVIQDQMFKAGYVTVEPLIGEE